MHHNSTMEMVKFQQQMRILHWQTTSYARHNAYGQIYDSLDDLIDKYVEICMGKYGRIELKENNSKMELKNMKDLSINNYLSEFVNFLIELNNLFNPKEDSDVLNLRDEILSEVNKLKYLLTLK